MNIQHRGDFKLIINLKKPPNDVKIPEVVLEEIIRILDKYKLLDELNFLEISRTKIDNIKPIDA